MDFPLLPLLVSYPLLLKFSQPPFVWLSVLITVFKTVWVHRGLLMLLTVSNQDTKNRRPDTRVSAVNMLSSNSLSDLLYIQSMFIWFWFLLCSFPSASKQNLKSDVGAMRHKWTRRARDIRLNFALSTTTLSSFALQVIKKKGIAPAENVRSFACVWWSVRQPAGLQKRWIIIKLGRSLCQRTCFLFGAYLFFVVIESVN